MNPSITSSPSFQARLLRAELWRLRLMGLCFGIMAVVWVLRRAFGGVVASNDTVFFITLALFLGVLSFITLAWFDTRRRQRDARPIPPWRLIARAACELGVLLAGLLVLHAYSPRGQYAALSAPAILGIPLILMLSILRLRPRYPLVLGAIAALAHWALVLDTLRHQHASLEHLPLLLTYGVLFAITGAAAAIITRIVRSYIAEAVEESETALRAQNALQTVQQELDIAREIQQSLLPASAPNVPGIEVAGMARPATEAGGDYYDWQPIADGRLVVAIADVTGHGIGPALVMAVCRAYSKATAPTTTNAEDFLRRLNELLSRDMSGGRFITMAVAIVGPEGAVDLLSAGHGPTFLYRAATGQVEQFGGNGLPLGIIDDETYAPTASLRLDPGDALVLLTDGFMEHPSTRGGIFGSNRLAEAIAQHGTSTPEALIRAIDAEVTRFADGAAQTDDMTAVVVRRSPT